MIKNVLSRKEKKEIGKGDGKGDVERQKETNKDFKRKKHKTTKELFHKL